MKVLELPTKLGRGENMGDVIKLKVGFSKTEPKWWAPGRVNEFSHFKLFDENDKHIGSYKNLKKLAAGIIEKTNAGLFQVCNVDNEQSGILFNPNVGADAKGHTHKTTLFRELTARELEELTKLIHLEIEKQARHRDIAKIRHQIETG